MRANIIHDHFSGHFKGNYSPYLFRIAEFGHSRAAVSVQLTKLVIDIHSLISDNKNRRCADDYPDLSRSEEAAITCSTAVECFRYLSQILHWLISEIELSTFQS